MGFRGSGGAPPEGSGRAGNKDTPFTLTEEIGEKTRRVNLFKVMYGTKDSPATLLDADPDLYTVLLHKFKWRGRWGNYTVCIQRIEPRGCPMCDALSVDRGSWHAALSLIDQNPWEIKSGKKAGTKRCNTRRLALVTEGHYKQGGFGEQLRHVIEENPTALRGREVKITRSTREESETSAAIGNSWYFVGKPPVTDEGLKTLCNTEATTVEIPVDTFIQPFDYESIFAPPSFEECKRLAAVFNGEQSKDVAGATAGAGGAEEAVPF